MSAVRIKDTDKGLKAVVKRLNTGMGSVAVGVFADKSGAYKGGTTVVQVAEIHEFGLGVPRRSFIADWADQNRGAINAQLKNLAIGIASNQITAPQARELFGTWAVGEVQKRISSGIPPALAESTIKRKGSSTPLIDSGQLRANVTFKTHA